MRNMLKTEWFKFTHSFSLWVIIGVLVASCSISILTGVFQSAEATLANISKDCMVPILACAIYSAIILTDDFSSGLLRHYISAGYKRDFIVLAKFIHYILGCFLLLLLYPLICVLLAALIRGAETSVLSVLLDLLFYCLRSCPLYAGMFAIFFAAAFVVQKGVISMGISVAASILIVVFTNKLYSAFPGILKYSPIIQIAYGNQGEPVDYFAALALSVIIIGFCLYGSIKRMNRSEL